MKIIEVVRCTESISDFISVKCDDSIVVNTYLTENDYSGILHSILLSEYIPTSEQRHENN